MRKLRDLVVVVETGLVIWAAYVGYRWFSVRDLADSAYADLVPYAGSFPAVVAPWIAVALFIPASAIALRVAQRSNKKD